jgi:surface polysaccharide O-acyltransferase-like enzyme
MAGKTAEIKEKNNTIESIRFIAAFAVILIHCFQAEGIIKIIVDQWARFAVPFFFAASGYFLAGKIKEKDEPIIYWNYLKKVLLLYVAWNLIYLLIPFYGEIIGKDYFSYLGIKFEKIYSHGFEYAIFHGWGFPFWFFASLALTIVFFFLFRKRGIVAMVVFSILLYVFGVLASSYSETSIGIKVPFFTRNYIFLSALPFSLGAFIHLKSIVIKPIVAITLLAITCALHFTEVFMFRSIQLSAMYDYGFFTFAMGVAALLVGLYPLKIFHLKWMGRLGKYSLGIYAVHVLIASYIYDLVLPEINGVRIYFGPILILFASGFIIFIIRKVPMLKKIT